MKSLLILLLDFLLAVFAAFVLASLFHTQFVLHELVKLGIEIDLTTRLSTSLDDMLGLLPTYGSAIALSLLLGFTATYFLMRRSTKFTPWLYPLAGGVALLSCLLAMHPILDITLIAGARSALGMTAQVLAGVFGGWAFMYQRNKRKH